MKIWTIPLEPIEQRYSKQWRSQFEEVFKKKNIEYEFVDGELVESNLKGKFFLDPIQTNIYKLSQLENILKRTNEIKDDDVVFLFDGWFPGIESLKYTFTFLQKKTKIIGYFHAGTYDKYDLTAQYGMDSWGKDLENSWFSMFDKILVSTNFHKSLILNERKIDSDKIKVVGFPLDINKIKDRKKVEKENLIAFTGRKSSEKGYDDILELQKKNYPIIVTLDKTKTKEEYYELLNKCKYVISTSNQETFGIGIVEGMALGCIPIVPKRLSYPETVGNEYCYTVEDIVKDFDKVIKNQEKLDKNIFIKKVDEHQYENVINKIIEEMIK